MPHPIPSIGFARLARCALGLAVALWGLAAQADLLLPVGLFGHGMVYLDDKAPVERQGSQVRVWSVTDYRDPQKNREGQLYRSSRSWIAVDCTAHRARILHLTFFSGAMQSGRALEQEGMLIDWQPIPPGSPMQKIHDRYC